MEQENIEDVIRIDREVIDEMMEVFKSFNYDIDNFNSKKTAFKNRCDIQEECSELLSEYGFILAKNNHELRKQQEAQGAAAQDEHDDVSGAEVSGAEVSGAEVSGAEVSGAEVSGAEVSGAKVAQPANEEEKKQRDVMTCLKDNEIIEKIKKSNHPELTLLISLSNKIKKTNYDSMTFLKKSVKEKKFTKEDVEKIFGFNFLSRNYLKMHMQYLAKEELKKKYQKQIDKIDAITNKPDATDRVRFALEFVTLWNGKKLDLPNLEVEQQDYLQKLKQRLEQRRQRLEQQRPPPSISGVFDKTKGNTPLGRLTKQTRYIIIDPNGFKWFESPDLKTKGSEKGSISLDSITGAVDAGEWNGRFGVEIKHPGIDKDVTYLWCTSEDERKNIIDVVTRLTGKRSAGGKRRKTIVKYKKNKQHKYKKKTNKRRYKNKNTRKSKSLKK
jgi:hypothetical protein